MGAIICPQCKNVFWEKKGMKYCSPGCAMKYRARRSYNLRKQAGVKLSLQFSTNLGDGIWHRVDVHWTGKLYDYIFHSP